MTTTYGVLILDSFNADIEGIYRYDDNIEITRSNFLQIVKNSKRLDKSDLLGTKYWDKSYDLITLTQSKINHHLRYYHTLTKLTEHFSVGSVVEGGKYKRKRRIVVIDLDKQWDVFKQLHKEVSALRKTLIYDEL